MSLYNVWISVGNDLVEQWENDEIDSFHGYEIDIASDGMFYLIDVPLDDIDIGGAHVVATDDVTEAWGVRERHTTYSAEDTDTMSFLGYRVCDADELLLQIWDNGDLE